MSPAAGTCAHHQPSFSSLLLCRRNTDHAAARVRQACLKSLKALRLDYLHLYLIHWPVTGSVGPEVKPSIQETWQVGAAVALHAVDNVWQRKQMMRAPQQLRQALCTGGAAS